MIDLKLNQKAAPFKNPLCIALDVDEKEQALKLVSELGDTVGGFKLGPRLIHRYGQDLVQTIAKTAPVFVDCKFFDIPSTMTAAVRASFAAGASFVTVHALSGKEALSQLAKLELELNKQRPFRILAVTILTSWDQNSLPKNLKAQNISEHVLDLAQLVIDSGLKSLVCSAEELALLKTKLPAETFYLTPGIRLEMQASGDQKRVMGPGQAIHAGSSALVVGRPIIEAANPTAAALDYMTAIYEK